MSPAPLFLPGEVDVNSMVHDGVPSVAQSCPRLSSNIASVPITLNQSESVSPPSSEITVTEFSWVVPAAVPSVDQAWSLLLTNSDTLPRLENEFRSIEIGLSSSVPCTDPSVAQRPP